MTDSASTTAAPAPVMDVVAPPAEKQSDAPEPVDPVDKLAADDQKSQQSLDNPKPSPNKPAPKAKQSATTHSGGVGMAITATVIIVLALAALATYAYIQTNK